MSRRLASLDDVLLMGPGPSCVPQVIYQALSARTLGHLDPDFIAIMDEIKTMLGKLFKAGEGALTLPMSGTGSSGMEAAFVNLIEPGDRVLILKNGVFGNRMEDLAGRLGAEVETMEWEWGTPVVVDEVRQQLQNSKPYKIVAVVHAETSTGVANPVEEIGQLLKEAENLFKDSGTLYLVDCVTSLGGMNVDVAGWGIDACYSGTQKCLSCPPGLAPLTFSARAVEVIKSRKTKVPNWYLDVTMLLNYWSGEKRVYHHTAPINMLYGLFAALELVLDEGLDVAFRRHRSAHERLVDDLKEIGLSMPVEASVRLPMLNAVSVPDGVDEAAVRLKLRNDFKIEIGPGLGPLAGKIWRVGLMGHTARHGNVMRLIEALEKCL
ncbi:MAG: alanine-glyoxylate transaminase/serine-glyoxylate transaminase/serine-pyruvate transaminase [Verrucomicrobiales bacterium]|jgi:alanine-glyoxylate transaminase/serine-glyoxylate transaminase/serine-pyruvate transaminase